MKACILLITLAGAIAAQETRREVVNRAPNPADDAKPASSAVPDAYAISGKFDRVVILRFKYDVDLLATMEAMVKREKIRNALFLSAMGSVRGYQIHQVSNRTFPAKDTYVQNPTGPADIIGVNGYVIDGRVHAHITLSNPEKAFGGHLEPGTHVFTFAVITLGVLNDGVDIGRVDDRNQR